MTRTPFTRRSLPAAPGATAATTALGSSGLLRAAAASAAIPGPASYFATSAPTDQHPPAPQWCQDATFVISHHWGVFSVPANASEWYPRNTCTSGSNEHNHRGAVNGDPSAWSSRRTRTAATPAARSSTTSGRTGRHPDAPRAHRRQHLQHQLVLHGRHRLPPDQRAGSAS
jgi:hypothetical protein